jgi:tRNA(Arg) A34 adenosine deaminase TadA
MKPHGEESQVDMSPDATKLLSTFLDTVETSIWPLTSAKENDSVASNIFGAAILSRNSMAVLAAAGNKDEISPLHHGEMVCIQQFFAESHGSHTSRPNPKDCVLLSSHEPCSMCLSAVAWCGFKEVYYLFSYEETRHVFDIPEDIDIALELFGSKESDGAKANTKELYNHDNKYFKSTSLTELVAGLEHEEKMRWMAEINRVKALYQAEKRQ